MQALKEAVESGRDEEEQAPAVEALAAYEWEAEPDQMVVPGSPASPGLAIGPLRFVKRSTFVVETTARDVEAEKTRLKEAIAAARVQLHDLYGEVKARSGAGQASIFLAQAEFLDDPELVEAVEGLIETGAGAGYAWQQAIDARVAELSMSIPAIAAIDAQLRRVSLARAQSLAQQALACRTAAEVRALPCCRELSCRTQVRPQQSSWTPAKPVAIDGKENAMGQEKRVVTVTINPAIDQTIGIPNFTAGTVNRVQSSRMDAGGKGINVASFLADYGQPATVTGFLGADNDEIFRRLFERKGIEDRCVRIAGQTRIGVKISDEALNQTTDINFPGETPSDSDIRRLFDILVELAASHEWFVLSGSIPRGVSTGIYREMVQTLQGKRVVLDTSGEGFAQAVSAGPWLIKPNVDELREYTGQPLDSHAAILAAARELSARYGIASVVISMGKQGAIFVEGDEALWAVPPAVKVKSTVGAGDAMVAGTVAAKLRGLSLADCARLATAFSTTAISHVGHDLPSVAEVEALRDRVIIRDLEQGPSPLGCCSP